MEENQENKEKCYKVSKDYRVLILLKYIYIGCSDICFWWTVWNIADHLWPMDITKDGALSYLRGYMLIMGANLYYMLFRLVFNELCQRFYEKKEKFVYPAVIITKEEVIKNKPVKFKLLKIVLPTFVYILVVGYIQVWRGLFGTFNYLVEYLHEKHGVNQVLSSVLCQLLVCITLAFTQKNNAVNLCPTHKIYKYDSLDELDGLLNLHVFNNLVDTKNSEFLEEEYLPEQVEEEIAQVETADNNTKLKRKITFTPLDHEFDIAQYAARKISGSFHRSSVSSNSSDLSRKLSEITKKLSTSSRKHSSQETFQKHRKSETNEPPRKLPAANRHRKMSRQEFFIANTFSIDYDKRMKSEMDSFYDITSTSFSVMENIKTIFEENEDVSSVQSSEEGAIQVRNNKNEIISEDSGKEPEHCVVVNDHVLDDPNGSLQFFKPKLTESEETNEDIPTTVISERIESTEPITSSEEFSKKNFVPDKTNENIESMEKPSISVFAATAEEVVNDNNYLTEKELETIDSATSIPSEEIENKDKPMTKETNNKVSMENDLTNLENKKEIVLEANKRVDDEERIDDLDCLTNRNDDTKIQFYPAQISPRNCVTSHEAVMCFGEELKYDIEDEFEHTVDEMLSEDKELSNNRKLPAGRNRSGTLLDRLHRRASLGVAEIWEIYENHASGGAHQIANNTHQITNTSHQIANTTHRITNTANPGHEKYPIILNTKSCQQCKICQMIKIFAYVYTIHHRQVFLHVFGGMFWSTTWKLFDFAALPFFTGTASDVPGLALIAMLCHCMNHLVLFRFKETASSLRWRTFWEFFCGIFTVCLWAPVWYIFDLIAIATGDKLKFQIIMNLVSFGSLALLGISINTAL